MILKEQLKNLSIDRMKHLGLKSRFLADTIDKEINDGHDKYTMFEVFYILSMALLYLLQMYGKKSLGYFTDIFNEMCLIYQHKEN